MSKFKVGDRVRCIKSLDHFTVGNEYTVEGINFFGDPTFVCDRGSKNDLHHCKDVYFELVSPSIPEQKEVKNCCYFCAKQFTEKCTMKSACTAGKISYEEAKCNVKHLGCPESTPCFISKLSVENAVTGKLETKKVEQKKNPLAVSWCKHPDCHCTAIDGTDYCYKHTGIPLTNKDLVPVYYVCFTCGRTTTKPVVAGGNRTYCADCFTLLMDDKPNPVLEQNAKKKLSEIPNLFEDIVMGKRFLMGGV